MKQAIGFIFMFTLINVSICRSPLRELEFIDSLYPHQDIPNELFTAIVNRRLDQISSLDRYFNYSAVAESLASTATKSLSSLVDILHSNDTSQLTYKYSDDKDSHRRFDQTQFYVDTVQILTHFYGLLDITSVDNLDLNLKTLKYLNYDSRDFRALLVAYIDDLTLVHEYEKSIGNCKRVDMTIIDSLKALVDEVDTIVKNTDGLKPYHTTQSPKDPAKVPTRCFPVLTFLKNKCNAT